MPAREGTCLCTVDEITDLTSSAIPCAFTCMQEESLSDSEKINCALGPDCAGAAVPKISDMCIGCIGNNVNALTGGNLDVTALISACMDDKGVLTDDTLCNGPYGGEFGIAVLSKVPIVKNEAVPFPGTVVFNRGFMHVSLATAAEEEPEQNVDMLCGWWRQLHAAGHHRPRLLPPGRGRGH